MCVGCRYVYLTCVSYDSLVLIRPLTPNLNLDQDMNNKIRSYGYRNIASAINVRRQEGMHQDMLEESVGT